MKEYRIRRARLITAEMRVPGDLAVSQRALIVAGLANGPSVLTGFLPAEECMDTIQACRALGMKFDYLSTDDPDLPWVSDDKTGLAGPTRLRVMGTSGNLRAPTGVIDCRRSQTALLLLSGLLIGQPFASHLIDAAGTSVRDILGPFREMGGLITASGPEETPPLIVGGIARLTGTTCGTPISSALKRDALLLAGLFAGGKTSVTEAAAGPDHLERLLRHYQVKTIRKGLTVTTWGGQMPESRDFHIPGDISYAAPFIVAAATQPGAALTVRGVGLNVVRTAFLRVLVRMGAQVSEEISDTRSGEPHGCVIVRGAPLLNTVIEEKETDLLHNELPVIAVAAAFARGSTVIHQTPATRELLARTARNLNLMGVETASVQQGIEITGTDGAPLQPGLWASFGDPRLVMAGAAAGLLTDGEMTVEDADCVESRWHGFGGELQRFQSRAISEGTVIPVVHAVPHKSWRPEATRPRRR